MADLKALFQWYLDNQSQLVEKYDGKYLVIKDNQVADAYDDEHKAYFDAAAKYGLGNFLIQLCTIGDEAYTQHYTSRVAF